MRNNIVKDGVLLRSSRPGYPSKDVAVQDVEAWIARAQSDHVRTVLCLLDEEQLAFYRPLGEGGLLHRYRTAGLGVIHRPVRDHLRPAIPRETLERIASDFLAAELPMLVHCSAGIDRTGAVVHYLTEMTGLLELRERVEFCMREHSGNRGAAHFQQVTTLALRLYDALETVHRLVPRYRAVLWAAAMLHDIGTAVSGPVEHAWRSGRLIMTGAEQYAAGADFLQAREVATVASLHGIEGATETEPVGSVDPEMLKLWPEAKIPRELLVLAGILRIADGLDRSLTQSVTGLAVSDAQLLVRAKGEAAGNIRRAQEKSGLLSMLLQRSWRITAAS